MIDGKTRKEIQAEQASAAILAECSNHTAKTPVAGSPTASPGKLATGSYRKETCTPLVIRGANIENLTEVVDCESVSHILENGEKRTLLTVDWLTVCGPLRVQEDALKVFMSTAKSMQSFWRNPEPETMQGRNGYADGIKYGDMCFQWGHASDNSAWYMNISGAGCASMGLCVLKDMLRRLYGFSSAVHVTRIDIAIDLVGGVESLLSDIELACESGHLARVRSYEAIAPKSAKTCEKLSQTIYLGSRRGERFIRVYDKGREQKLFESDQWIRWEYVQRGIMANKLAADWVGYRLEDQVFYNENPSAGHLAGLRESAVNLVCFEDSRGRSPGWWQSLYSRLHQSKANKQSSNRKDRDADKYCHWLQSQVLPVIDAVASASGLDRGAVFAGLLRGVPANPGHGSSIVAALVGKLSAFG